MNHEDKIAALLELDGLNPVEHDGGLWSLTGAGGRLVGYKRGASREHCLRFCGPKYLLSYDAIIPLIRKQPENIKQRMAGDLTGVGVWCIELTTAELCEAILRAAGKWIE